MLINIYIILDHCGWKCFMEDKRSLWLVENAPQNLIFIDRNGCIMKEKELRTDGF